MEASGEVVSNLSICPLQVPASSGYFSAWTIAVASSLVPSLHLCPTKNKLQAPPSSLQAPASSAPSHSPASTWHHTLSLHSSPLASCGAVPFVWNTLSNPCVVKSNLSIQRRRYSLQEASLNLSPWVKSLEYRVSQFPGSLSCMTLSCHYRCVTLAYLMLVSSIKW